MRSFFIVFLLAFTACVQQPIKPPLSQLEIREMQTRSYEGKDLITAMKAVINALQDEGFIIKNADKDLGFIQATKESDIEDSSERIMFSIFAGQEARWQKNVIIDCSANLTQQNKTTKVRTIFQRKIEDNMGNPSSVEQITSLSYYQQFFSKIDKSLFIEKQGL